MCTKVATLLKKRRHSNIYFCFSNSRRCVIGRWWSVLFNLRPNLSNNGYPSHDKLYFISDNKKMWSRTIFKNSFLFFFKFLKNNFWPKSVRTLQETARPKFTLNFKKKNKVNIHYSCVLGCDKQTNFTRLFRVSWDRTKSVNNFYDMSKTNASGYRQIFVFGLQHQFCSTGSTPECNRETSLNFLIRG